MEDPVNSATGRTARRYTITSRGHLSTMSPDTGGLCYNEVFLPQRPVSRLNVDVDLKCCQKCNGKFATHAERSTKPKVSEALVLVIAESLLKQRM